MAYGLTSAGYTRPTLTDIIADTKNEYRYVFGQNVNVAENSMLDKIITIQAEREIFSLGIDGKCILLSDILGGRR